MNIALLLTSHRQIRELGYWPQFMNQNPVLAREAEVFYHSNYPDLDEAAVRATLDRIPCKASHLIREKANAGYLFGNFQAVSLIHPLLAERGFDWVIKLHPDVFIIDERPILRELESTPAEVPLLVSQSFGDRTAAYSADFFCFRPQTLPADFFNIYRPFSETGKDVWLGEEQVLFFEAHRREIPHRVVRRYRSGHYHRCADLMGLWHSHSLDRVERAQSGKDALLPHALKLAAKHPKAALRMTAQQLVRGMRGQPQEPLTVRLTALE